MTAVHSKESDSRSILYYSDDGLRRVQSCILPVSPAGALSIVVIDLRTL